MSWSRITNRAGGKPTGSSGRVVAHNGNVWTDVDVLFKEEFLGSPGSFMSAQGGLVGAWNWAANGDGVFEALTSEALHPGIVRLETSGADGDVMRAALGGTIGTEGTDWASQCSLGDVAFVHFIVRIPSTSSLSNANYGIGFAQDVADGQVSGTVPNLGTNGLIVHKHTGSSAWIIRRETDSSSSQPSTGRTAALGDWVEVWGINQGSGAWSFTTNGGSSVAITGVSTSAMVRPMLFVHQTAAGTRQLDVDTFEFGLRFSSNRFTA